MQMSHTYTHKYKKYLEGIIYMALLQLGVIK